jgi:hypothetical protein
MPGDPLSEDRKIDARKMQPHFLFFLRLTVPPVLSAAGPVYPDGTADRTILGRVEGREWRVGVGR